MIASGMHALEQWEVKPGMKSLCLSNCRDTLARSLSQSPSVDASYHYGHAFGVPMVQAWLLPSGNMEAIPEANCPIERIAMCLRRASQRLYHSLLTAISARRAIKSRPLDPSKILQTTPQIFRRKNPPQQI